MTPLEILTSYLAGTLLLVYIHVADPSTSPSSPSLPLPLEYSLFPLYLHMAIYGLQVMASVIGIGTWFFGQVSYLDLGRGGLFPSPPL